MNNTFRLYTPFLRQSHSLTKLSPMSKVIPVSCKGVIFPDDSAQKAAETLDSGKVIATPTDTIYGIAALVQNDKAVKKLYQIKGRNPDKPIAICVADIDEIYSWAKVSIRREVLEKLLPGPVTVVFKRQSCLNPNFNPKTSLIGIRIPDFSFIRQICRLCSGPLALTSANLSSGQSPLAVEEFQHLWPQLDIVCDGGRLGDTEEARLGSTVIDFSVEGKYKIIRNGSALNQTEIVLKEEGLVDC